MKLFLDDVELQTLQFNKAEALTEISTITVPNEIAPGTYTLKAIVTDDKGYSDVQSVDIEIRDGGTDTTPPYLMKNKMKISQKDDGTYEVVFLFGDDASTISNGGIVYNGEVIHQFTQNVAIFSLPTLGEVSYAVEDSAGNKTE